MIFFWIQAGLAAVMAALIGFDTGVNPFALAALTWSALFAIYEAVNVR